MMFRSILFLGCVLSLTTPSLTLAARSNPCTEDGQLKRWAEKYYDADYCSPVAANTAPTLTILSPTSGSSVEADAMLTLQASAMDKEDGDISSKVFWYSSVDGKVNSTTALSAGEHTITAAVFDSEGLVAKEAIKLSVIEVVNSAPTVAITSPSGQSTFSSDQVISFQAVANDAEDGDLTSSIKWTSSIDGAISSSTTLSAGTHAITAAVSDSELLTASDAITITINEVIQNTAPALTILSPASGSSVEAGVTLTLQASAIDKEDGDISSKVFWYSSVDGKVNSTTALSAGEHTITAAVFDSEGLVAKEAIKLSVIEVVNSAPTVAITSPSGQSTFSSDQVISFQAVANDAEDGDLTSSIKWTSSIDGAISSSTTLSAGTHTITAAVSDSELLTASNAITITINEVAQNTAPALTILSPASGSSVEAGVTLTLQASAIDKEDGDISSKVFWYSSVDGKVNSTTALSAGEHTITAAVFDSEGLVAKEAIKLSVVAESINAAPSVSITSPYEGSIVEEGTTLLLKANAFDSEDGDLTASVTWYSSIDGSINNLTTLSVGEHTLYASVVDSQGAIAEDQIKLSIVGQSSQPTTHSVTISWNPPVERADGSMLSVNELSGYRINWQNSTTGTSGSIDVDSGLATYYEVNNLQSGSYRFSLNSIDINGLISLNSQEMTIDLN